MYGRPERMQARKHFPNKKLWPRSHLLPQVQYSRRFKLFMIVTCFKIAFGNWGRYRVYSIHKYGVTVLHITDAFYFFVFQQVEAFFSRGQGLDFFKLSPKVIACLSLAWCVNFFINVNPLLEVAAHLEYFGSWVLDWTAGVFLLLLCQFDLSCPMIGWFLVFFPPQEDEEPPDCRYAVNQLKCPATLEIPTLCEVKRSWMVYSDTIQTPSGRATHQPPLRYNARVLFFYFMWFVTARASLFVHLVGSQTFWSCLNSVEFKQTKVSVVYFYDINPQKTVS